MIGFQRALRIPASVFFSAAGVASDSDDGFVPSSAKRANHIRVFFREPVVYFDNRSVIAAGVPGGVNAVPDAHFHARQGRLPWSWKVFSTSRRSGEVTA